LDRKTLRGILVEEGLAGKDGGMKLRAACLGNNGIME
jgi:hypothetical protein